MLKEYLKHTKTNAHYYSITSVSETTLVIISNLNPIQTGGGLKYPQRQKCLQNSENRKKIKKTTTNLPRPPSSPLPP